MDESRPHSDFGQLFIHPSLQGGSQFTNSPTGAPEAHPPPFQALGLPGLGSPLRLVNKPPATPLPSEASRLSETCHVLASQFSPSSHQDGESSHNTRCGGAWSPKRTPPDQALPAAPSRLISISLVERTTAVPRLEPRDIELLHVSTPLPQRPGSHKFFDYPLVKLAKSPCVDW